MGHHSEQSSCKWYITTANRTIESFMHYISIPKVTIYHEEIKEEEVLEIQMVYNGTSCRLN
jgi:Cu/Ag efflux protein CusF